MSFIMAALADGARHSGHVILLDSEEEEVVKKPQKSPQETQKPAKGAPPRKKHPVQYVSETGEGLGAMEPAGLRGVSCSS